MILKGNILITSDKNIIYEVLRSNNPGIKILNLDEDEELGVQNNMIVPGTILLPPIEAKIAELDGDENRYNMIYNIHLQSKPVVQYMAGILGYLFNGGNIMMYFPNAEYNNTMKNMLFFILLQYGIHIGIVGDTSNDNSVCYYDPKFEAYQLNLIYQFTRVIDWRQYFILFPIDAPIPDQIVDILCMDIHPYGLTIQEKLDTLTRIRTRIKENPNTIIAVTEI